MKVQEALEMLDEYQTYWSEIYERAQEDLEFVFAPETQWSDADRKAREGSGRPCLTVPVLSQFIHQVTNQIRQNTPSINVLPASEGSSIETAKAYKGLIRNIEYRSGADEVYDTSAEYSVTSSLGFIRVDHDYIASDSFDQELLIKRVQNPHSVWIDPSSTECDGCDANGAIVIDTITKKQFEKQYPGKKFVSFEKGANYDEKRETITIGEIFVKDYEVSEKTQLDDGAIVDYDEKLHKDKKRRKLKKTVIRRYKFSGDDLLEETVFPGEYIPLVPVYGQEVWVDGKRHLLSLIRQAKDAQRRYNHWASVESEILSKAPKAPFVAEAGTIEDFAEDWQNPDSANVLRWKRNNLEGGNADAPQRSQAISVPIGIINAMQGAYEDIKRALGLYDASVGQKSNETSGIAIENRKQQGDVATFHFADNLSRSIAQVGRILVGAIPTIYDNERIIQIIGEEDEPQMVSINSPKLMEGQEAPYNLAEGKYDVRVTTGPSFTTRRQEAAFFYSEAAKADPTLWQKAGDLIVKNMDFPGAEALSNRLKKTIPPEILEGEDGEQAPTPRELQLQQQMQQMQMQMQEMGAALQDAQGKANDKRGDAIKIQMDGEYKQADLQLKQQEQQIKQEEAAAKIALDNRKLDIEERKLALEEQKAAMGVYERAEDRRIQLDTTGFQFSRTPEEQQRVDGEAEAASMKEEEERAFKQAEMEQRQILTMAMVEAIQSIGGKVDELVSRVNVPMEVVRDVNGAIVGSRPVTIQ